MSLVINTNEQATRIHGVYNRNNTQMNAAMTRVATAQKINSARDGAANWAISEKMRERIRANSQANQNVQNDTALLKTAQGGIDNTIDILKTLKERAINAANDSNVSTDRAAIATEVLQLVNQIDDNAAKVKFNGRTLIDGSLAAGVTDVIGASGTSSTSGVTASGLRGDKAVYQLTGLQKATDTANTVTAATGTDKIVELTDSSGGRLFQAGDKIKLSWTENGASKSSEITITTGTTVAGLSDLKSGGITGIAYTAANTEITDSTKDYKGTAVSSTDAGVYITGAKDTTISNVSLSITRDGSNVTAAEQTFKLSGVQQSVGPAVGSNLVYATTTDAKVNGAGDGTKLMELKKDNTVISGSATSTAKFAVGDKSITVNGNATISDINAELEKAGINYKLVLADKGDTVDGVTRGTGDNVGPLISDRQALYYVATNGESRAISVTGSFTDINSTDLIISRSSEAGSSGGNGSLTFHVGGEADFYMDIGIRNMTSSSLLGSTSASFASMFTDKESARSAIDVIDNALQTALNEQTRLGSIESRLGYTSDNIVTMNENLEAADSAYRDADIAKEMTNYMKYAVLSQASQYMLAQAGQNGYQVLNLLNA